MQSLTDLTYDASGRVLEWIHSLCEEYEAITKLSKRRAF